jgi:thymidine kinase
MSLEIICGPMCAGKSTTLLSRISKANVLGWKYLIFTSALDTRYSSDAKSIQTHDGRMIEATPCLDLHDIFTNEKYNSTNIVIIEEAQFFKNLYSTVCKMVDVDLKHVILVGLDGDYERKPIGEVLKCIPIADTVTRLTAYCSMCKDGTLAPFTALIREDVNSQIFVGGLESYKPVCRKHYIEFRRTLLSYET